MGHISTEHLFPRLGTFAFPILECLLYRIKIKYCAWNKVLKQLLILHFVQNNRATAFLFNNCENLLFRTSHSNAQLRSNRQVRHVYLIHDANSLQVSLLTESKCTYQFFLYFLIVISCSVGRNELQKLQLQCSC